MTRLRRLGPLALVVLFAAACSAGGGNGGGDGASSSGGGTEAPASGEATESAAPTPGEGEFVNPVIRNFPDPDVMQVGDTFYVYATNNRLAASGSGNNIQIASSADLVNWERLPDALPELAAWSGMTPLFRAQPTPRRGRPT